jgi:hypothetical protein
MSPQQIKALLVGVAVLGYVAALEIASYVLKRRFTPALRSLDLPR